MKTDRTTTDHNFRHKCLETSLTICAHKGTAINLSEAIFLCEYIEAFCKRDSAKLAQLQVLGAEAIRRDEEKNEKPEVFEAATETKQA